MGAAYCDVCCSEDGLTIERGKDGRMYMVRCQACMEPSNDDGEPIKKPNRGFKMESPDSNRKKPIKQKASSLSPKKK